VNFGTLAIRNDARGSLRGRFEAGVVANGYFLD
jgi:hypothetical protein